MALVPQIFGGGQLHIDALGLEDHADLAAQFVGLFRRVKSHDHGAAAARHHQGRKNAEHRGLAAAVGSEQSKQFGVAHVERNAVQRGATVIAMDQILDRDYSGNGRRDVLLEV